METTGRLIYYDGALKAPKNRVVLLVVFIIFFILLTIYPSLALFSFVVAYALFASVLHPMIGLSIWIFFIPFEHYFLNHLQFSPYIGITTSVLFGCFIHLLTYSRHLKFLKIGSFIFSFSFFTIAVLSWLLNPDIEMARSITSLALLLAIFVIITWCIEQDSKAFLLFSIALIVVSLLSLVYADIAGWRIELGGSVRSLSNVIGISLIILSGGALFNFKDHQLLPSNNKKMLFVLFLLLGIALSLTVSRGVIIAVIVTILSMIFIRLSWKRPKIKINKGYAFLISSSLVLISLLSINYFGRISEQLITRLGYFFLENVRFQIWWSALSELEGINWILGAGLESFEQLSPTGHYPHSVFIDVLFSTGLLGLAVFLVFLTFIFWKLVKKRNVFGIGLFLFMIISFIPHGSLHSKFFWLVLALTNGLAMRNDT